MTMDVSLDELVLQLKDEILEEAAADDGEETDDQDEIDIESYFSINKSDFHPVVINHTSKDNKMSSKDKWIPKLDVQTKTKTLDLKSESKNTKLPIIVLKSDNLEVINNAITPDQLFNRNPNQILKMTQAKSTTASTKPKVRVIGINNDAKQLNKLVPVKVRVIKEKEPTVKEQIVKDTNKQSELELRVKLLNDLLDHALSKIPPKTNQEKKITEDCDETTQNAAAIREKQPKIMKKQLNVTKNLSKVIKIQTKASEERQKITEKQQNNTENLKNKLVEDFYSTSILKIPTGSTSKRKISEIRDKTFVNSGNILKKQPKLLETDMEQHSKVPEKQFKVIEKGLKITEAQPIASETPPYITDNLKVKLLKDLLEPKQMTTEKSIEPSRNTDSEKQPKITKTPYQITVYRNTILYSEPPLATGSIMADKTICEQPIVKAGNLTKIDYKQIKSITIPKINKYLANAAPKITETQIEPTTVTQRSNTIVQQSLVTTKSQSQAKLPKIVLRRPIKATLRNANNPNSGSTVNTPSVHIISKEVVRNKNIGNITMKCSAPSTVFNDENSIQLDEEIKPTTNQNQIIFGTENTFEDEILGHTEIVNEEQNINIEDALESTAEVTIKDEVHTNHDILETAEVQETNGDSVQVMDVTDPLFIEHEIYDDNINNVQRTEEEKYLKTKPSTLKYKTDSLKISPTYCKICQRVFFNEDSFKNHKHKYLKCVRKFITQKALEEHKLKEHSTSLVQTKTKSKHQKQKKKKSCRKSAKVSGTNILTKLPQSCLFKMMRQTVLHSIKDRPIKRSIRNQNSERPKKLNHAERSDEVTTTEEFAEVKEIDTREETTHDQQIGKNRIEKGNDKITASKSSSTLDEGTPKKQNHTVLTENKADSRHSVDQRFRYRNLDFLDVKQKWHLIQKTALFECENCSFNFSEYPKTHYELCILTKLSNQHNECYDCNKKISYIYNDKTQHKFQHLLDYKPKTIPINSTKSKVISECPICRFHFFYTRVRLVAHVKDCTGKSCAKYKCCGFVFDKRHYNVHLIDHTTENILLTYDLLIKTRLEELHSEDEGRLITIDELKKLQTADSSIIYAFGDKYRVVSPNEFMSLEAGRYQCGVCKYKAVSQIELTQHEKKHAPSRPKARQGPLLGINMTTGTASSSIASFTCKLCRFVAGRKVEFKFHQLFTCPARKSITNLAAQAVSVRETLRSLAPKKK